MRLLEIETKNILGLPDRKYDLSGDVTLVTGGPASGKTSFLRAIVGAKESVGPYGAPPRPQAWLRAGATEGRIAARWSFSEREQKASKLSAAVVSTSWAIHPSGGTVEADAALQFHLSRYSNDKETGKLEIVPAPRCLPHALTAPLPPSPSDGSEAARRSGEDVSKYASSLRAVHDAIVSSAARTVQALDERGVALRSGVPDPLNHHKAAVASLCPDLRLLSAEPRAEGRPLLWFQNRKGTKVELASLSQAEHQALLFALLFETLGLQRSIVLFDTPELHIHPADQARFFQAVCRLGQDNQIIAATTSPAILASASPVHVIDLTPAQEQKR